MPPKATTQKPPASTGQQNTSKAAIEKNAGIKPSGAKSTTTKASGDFNAKHPRAPAGSSKGGQFAPGNSGSAPTNARPVAMGQSGKQTTDLQNRLREFGYKVDPDGQFGPKTRAAVIAFQKTHKDASGKPLKVDGLVGPKTTSALRKNTKQEYIRKVAGSRRMTAATAKGPKASGKE